VTTKQATNSATAAALNAGPVSSAQVQIQPPSQQQQQDRNGRRSSSSGLPAAGFAASAAQDLRLHVPAIGARLDSRQFEVLVDVIQNIAMAPLPTVSSSAAVCMFGKAHFDVSGLSGGGAANGSRCWFSLLARAFAVFQDTVKMFDCDRCFRCCVPVSVVPGVSARHVPQPRWHERG
jgi:hypothetical protein